MRTEKINRGRRFIFDKDEMKKMVRENLENRNEEVPDDGVEIGSTFYQGEDDEDEDGHFCFDVKGKPGERK